MYSRFFGFNERPFKLVPNPDYLYMSQTHQEAMAHLVYALDSGDGFVEITGEVGTGKTTLCRSFIEGLDKNTEVAYIFNPVLDPVELLRAVNAEFGISDDGQNTRALINSLNAFLIEQKAQAREVILVIDEAQLLTRNELEQIRLISNLETTRSKLLQIILVGQPELRHLLNSQELRQLRQRITLSCHLQPLSLKDTENYIRHRLKLASRGQAVTFSHGAVEKIFKYSRGIPRLINISCDRALLTAFGLDQRKVSTNIAGTAIKELEIGTRAHGLRRPYQRKTMLVMACVIALILLVAGYELRIFAPLIHDQISAVALDPSMVALKSRAPEKEEEPKAVPALQADLPLTSVDKTPEDETAARVHLMAFLNEGRQTASREEAFEAVADLWHIDSLSIPGQIDDIDDFAFFQQAGRQNGLTIYRSENDLELLIKLDLPAVLKFISQKSLIPFFLILTGSQDDLVLLRDGKEGEEIMVSVQSLKASWSGVAYIPWKNFMSLSGTLPGNAGKEDILILKRLLREIGYNDIDPGPEYDRKTRNAIIQVQRQYGLTIDGVVGSMTKIVLYKEKKSLVIPSLEKTGIIFKGGLE
ncbi:AAA family ATPase [Desulfocicer niacini]